MTRNAKTGQASQDLILNLIEQNPGIRPGQLRELTGLPQRTVTWNLQQLRLKEFVQARDDLRDRRNQCYYTVQAWRALQSPRVVAGVQEQEATRPGGSGLVAAGGKA
jgi:DNA-binding MarR family transcriptional regulator